MNENRHFLLLILRLIYCVFSIAALHSFFLSASFALSPHSWLFLLSEMRDTTLYSKEISLFSKNDVEYTVKFLTHMLKLMR